MGRNVWWKDTYFGMNSMALTELKLECARQVQSCLYTSTSLYIWLRWVRFFRVVFVLAPLLLSGLAALGLTKFNFPNYAVVILSFLASFFPALQYALKIETSIEQIAREASRYKALQDRFRQVATISVAQGEDVALREFSAAMDDLNSVRAGSITAPERYFKKAQKKIADGDYDFSVEV